MRCGCGAATATRRPVRRSSTRSSISRHCSARCCWITTCPDAPIDSPMRSRCARGPGVRCVLARRTQVQERGYHRRGIRPRVLAHRHQRQDAYARRLPRHGGGRVLRLHAMSRRLSDGARHTRRSGQEARPRCVARAGRVHHHRSRARHARAPRAVRAGVQPEIRRASRRCAGDRARRQGVQGRVPQGARQRTGQLHDGPLRRDVRVRSAGSAAAVREPWAGCGRARARPAGAAANAGVSDAQARAREAAGRLGAALERVPHDARLRHEHAQALKAAGDVNGAIRTLAAGVSLAPMEVERWLALAGLLMEVELASSAARQQASPSALSRAIEAIEHALALAPQAPAVLAQAAMTFRYACAWERAHACEAALERAGADPGRAFVVAPMMATALLDDPALQARAIRDFVIQTGATASERTATPLVRERGNALRVGYLSADFHEHATAHLAAGLFEAHDRKRLTTIAYALDLDDGSAMRQRLVHAFAHWRDIRALDDVAAAATIAADALDVLVDLKGHTQGGRMNLLARRPAPLQIHYLGFPGTLGTPAIDAQVADPIVVPAGDEANYHERVLRMPLCYQVNDRKRPLPPAARRVDAGLPERGLVFVSFNQTYKLARSFVDAWLEVLREHDDAVLWLNVPHALARENLRAAASERGVDAKRIVFASFVPQH